MGQWPECGPRYQHNHTLTCSGCREVSSSRCCIYCGFCNVRFTWLQAGPVYVMYHTCISCINSCLSSRIILTWKDFMVVQQPILRHPNTWNKVHVAILVCYCQRADQGATIWDSMMLFHQNCSHNTTVCNNRLFQACCWGLKKVTVLARVIGL